jgi:hypothetical protein
MSSVTEAPTAQTPAEEMTCPEGQRAETQFESAVGLIGAATAFLGLFDRNREAVEEGLEAAENNTVQVCVPDERNVDQAE